jgi:putative spermidine/putrescine transport system permease protein
MSIDLTSRGEALPRSGRLAAPRLPVAQLFGSGLAWVGYVFLLLPSLIVIPISFGGGGELVFPPQRFSLELFVEFFSNPSWYGAAVQSLIVALLTMAVCLLAGVPAAYALVRGSFPGRQFLEVALLAPMLVPVIVLGLGFYIQLSLLGMVDTLTGIVLAHVVVAVPFVLLAVTAGLRHADPALETVALLMGASRLRIFFQVVVPQIRGSILVAALFAFLISFDEVVIAYFVTGPDTTTLPVRMYSAIRWEISPVLAAVSTLLTAVSLLVCLVLLRLQDTPTPTAATREAT